jgi:tetratricopeptide (TPR) repeat protein
MRAGQTPARYAKQVKVIPIMMKSSLYKLRLICSPAIRLLRCSCLLFFLSPIFFFLFFSKAAWADNDSNTLFQEAEKLYQAGEYRSALEKYKGIILVDPSFIKGYRGITQCYFSLGDPQGALKFMESLFLEHPENGGVLYGLGYSLYDLGRYDDALAYFKKAIELNRNIAAAWNNCGVIYHFISKDYRRARYYYEQAIAISEKSGEDWVLKRSKENMANLPEPEMLKAITEEMTLEDFINRFIACAESDSCKEIPELVLGQKEKSRKAMEWLIGKAARSYAEGNLEDEKILIALAEILQDEYSISFKSPELHDLFKRYTGLSGNDKKKKVEGEDLLEQGLAKEQDGRYAEAAADYQEALNCFAAVNDRSGQGLAFLYLGDAHRKLKDYPIACDFYKKALPFFDETGEGERKAHALSSLGETCYVMGKYSEGIEYMNQSLEIYGLLQDQDAVKRLRANLELIKGKSQ